MKLPRIWIQRIIYFTLAADELISVKNEKITYSIIIFDCTDKNTTKFAKWLEVSSLTDMKIGQDQIEIFGFLANMTAQEVGKILLLYLCQKYLF